MQTNKLLVISVDALNARDLEYIKKLPNFSTFFEDGSYIKNVFSIYPSLTYCCHSSIITGNYPDRHGIYHNEIANPSDPLLQFWFWHKKNIKTTTLFDEARKKGLTTANVLWPVMANAKGSIQHNIPEIWSDHGISSFRLFLKNGSLHLLPLVQKHQHLLSGKKQPYLDNFSEAVAIDLIKSKKPDLLTIHFTEVDTMRHYHGVFSKEAYRALDSVDQRIGNILRILKERGLSDSTNVILLGDHGGTDYLHAILLNSLFLQKGLLEVDDHSNIISWKAYANGAGGSCQIVLSDPDDPSLIQRVEGILRDYMDKKDSPLRYLFNKEEAKTRHHSVGNFSFIVEAKDGFIFKNNVLDRVITDLESIDCHYICDHGYLPEHENMRTLLLAKGPGIKKGEVIYNSCLVNEGPTFAKLLNCSLENTDGKVIHDLLN